MLRLEPSKITFRRRKSVQRRRSSPQGVFALPVPDTSHTSLQEFLRQEKNQNKEMEKKISSSERQCAQVRLDYQESERARLQLCDEVHVTSKYCCKIVLKLHTYSLTQSLSLCLCLPLSVSLSLSLSFLSLSLSLSYLSHPLLSLSLLHFSLRP